VVASHPNSNNKSLMAHGHVLKAQAGRPGACAAEASGRGCRRPPTAPAARNRAQTGRRRFTVGYDNG